MSERLAVFMLDVGQGDSTVVLLPNQHAVVFDCADDQVLRKLLENWKVPVIEAFILSHLDRDHISGALQFLRDWPHPLGTVYLSNDRDISDAHEEAKRAKELVDHVVMHGKDAGVRPRKWELVSNTRDPRSVAAGVGWSIRLLAPPQGQFLQREREGAWEECNRYSSILRVEAGGNVMLIGGDAPLLSWSELPEAERKAQVFRIPHHGGALDDGGIPLGWDVERLYREVDADTALVSVGTNNGYSHPKEPWVRPIIGGTCRLLCTQVTARCHAALDLPGEGGTPERDAAELKAQRARVLGQPGFSHWTEPQWRHLTDRRQKVREGMLELPCAGTVIISMHLNGTLRVLPQEAEHGRLVDSWHRPLCRLAPEAGAPAGVPEAG